jgi:hypothetical protein
MDITSRDVILLGHAAFGSLAGVAALWVFVETLNARPVNAGRTYNASLIAAIAMGAAWLVGYALACHRPSRYGKARREVRLAGGQAN